MQFYERVLTRNNEQVATGVISCSQCCTWHSWSSQYILLTQGDALSPISQLFVIQCVLKSL